MQSGFSNTQRKLSILLSFIAVGALMIPAFPTVFATNSPTIASVPLIPVVGGSVSISLTADLASVSHVKGKVRFYEPGKAPGSGSGIFSGACDFGATVVSGPATRKVIEFRKFTNPTAANEYTMTTGGGTLVIPVASGVVTPSLGTGVSLNEPTGVWVVVEGSGVGLPDSIEYLTSTEGAPYRPATCGYDGGGAVTFQYNQNTATATQKPVAGEIIPIDTTALLIAGASSNPLMVLSALAIIAGGAFTLMRFQVIRKNF